MIVNKISEIIGKRRIKRTELAKLSGVSLSTIHRLYYNQTKGIDFDTLNRMCAALNLTPGELFEFIPDEK